jgi:GTP-binding protein EngB required for normal cell division
MTEAETFGPPKETPASQAQEAATAGDPETLRFYTKTKLALATQLRALREVIKQRGSETRLWQCDDLMVKLAEDRFTLAVLGQFKRGKSSLMNAIIGRELLPVGVLPLTSAITILRYGPQERLLIRRENMSLPPPEEFPVQQLAEFVTEIGNPGNCKQVKTATIETPLVFLRRGLEFVDTPGVGSVIEANTATTMNFLPDCDAVLFVTSVDSPFTCVELEFLENIRQHVRKIFFIVNKTDLLGADERREVLDFVGDTILRRMGTDNVKIFPISSRLGLAAKRNGDRSDALASGLTDLETTLASFLSGEKASVFLTAIIERALWLLEQEATEMGLRAQANELPEPVLVERLEKVTGQWESRKAERRQIFERLQRRILSKIDVALMPELRSFVRAETGAFADAVERLLIPLRWWPLGHMWEKIEQTALNQTCENVLGWLSERAERFSFASDEVARADWQRVQSNLAGLPVIAADIFGVRHVTNAGGEMLPPWHLNVKFEPPPAFNFQCRVRLPAWPAMLPVGLTRKWLKEHLRKESEQLANKWLDAVILYAADNMRKALEHLAGEVEKHAHGIGLRVMASVRGQPATAGSRDGEPLEKSETGAETINDVRNNLLALRDEILPTEPSAAAASDEPHARLAPVSPASAPRISLEISARKLSEPDPARDLKTRACPVCNHLSKVAFEFFARFQYDLSRDETTQQSFAETLGFCSLHTWQLEAIASPVGLSIGFAKLAEHISHILAARAKSPSNGHVAVKLVRGSAECHVCRLLRETEQDYLRRLAKFIESAEGRAAYARSQSVCLRHLGLWLPFLNMDGIARFVLEESSRRFEQMSEDMQSFSLKSDALRRQLQNTDESDAYLRAIIHLVGTKGNCQPFSEETTL